MDNSRLPIGKKVAIVVTGLFKRGIGCASMCAREYFTVAFAAGIHALRMRSAGITDVHMLPSLVSNVVRPLERAEAQGRNPRTPALHTATVLDSNLPGPTADLGVLPSRPGGML